MKKLIIICITAVLCAAIIMMPIYYKTFFEDDYDKTETPVVTATVEPNIDKYIVLSSSYSPLCALLLDKESGAIYLITARDIPEVVGNLNRLF